MKPETMLPERLRELRSGIKMTQVQIATALGESVMNYNKWENGTEPALSTIIKIAKFHGVTTDYLLGVSDDKSNRLDHAILIDPSLHMKLWLAAADMGMKPSILAERIIKIFLYKR